MPARIYLIQAWINGLRVVIHVLYSISDAACILKLFKLLT